MSIEIVGFRFVLIASKVCLTRLIDYGKNDGRRGCADREGSGDPNRLAIYSQIAQHDELFCGEMHAKHTISSATLSHHLKVLSDLGLITFRKEGLNVYYRVIPEKFAEYLKFLARIGPRPSQ